MLLDKLISSVKTLSDSNDETGISALQRSTIFQCVVFYLPILISMFYLIKYQKKLIYLFGNIKYIENRDLVSEISNLNTLEFDLDKLGDGFSNKNI